MEAASRPMDLTAQAGLTLVSETLLALGSDELAARELCLHARRRGYTSFEKLQWLVLLLAAGGERVEDIRVLGRDAGLCRLLSRRAPSPDALHDFLGAFHDESLMASRTPEGAWIAPESAALEGLHRVQVGLLRRGVAGERPPVATLDLDATIVESRRQEALPHYDGGRGYQPVVVVWAEEDLVVADQYRDGNVPAGMRNREVIARALAALPGSVHRRLFRADSACYEQAVLEYLWRERVEFTISADLTRELRAVVSDRRVAWTLVEDRARETVEAAEIEFTPGDWPKGAPALRYVGIRFQAKQGHLFADDRTVKHLAVVSNREDLSLSELLRWHWAKAGTIEHVHGVIKNELAGGFVPSQRFGANAAWFRINLLTYNTLSLLRRRALPPRLREARPKRLRYEIFSLAATVRQHAREVTARLGVPELTVEELIEVRRGLLRMADRWKAAEVEPPLPLA
jgi:hypothetical protein